MSVAVVPAIAQPWLDKERDTQILGSQSWSWPKGLRALRESFGSGHPFPHLVLDDVFNPSELMRLRGEVPDPCADHWTFWGSGGDECCIPNNSKRGISSLMLLGEFTVRFLQRLNSENFVADLRTITGESDLSVDHTFNGGGLHRTGRGGRLGVHADKVRHPAPTLFDQAVNLILFVEPNWRGDWGGELEFRSSDARARCASVLPRFNRLVLFRSDRNSFHGQPQPLMCPEGVFRTSLAVYYYRPRTGTLPIGQQNGIDWRS